MIRRRARGEDGGGLILALVFLLVVALFVLPMVTFLDVGQRTTVPRREARARAVAADAALDAAIHRFRLAGCEDYLAPTDGTGAPLAGQEMLVRCSAAGGGGSTSTPKHALLALGGRGDEDGVTSTAGNLRVRGSVFSHSTRLQDSGGGSVRAAGTGNLLVDGKVSALGDCVPVAKVQARLGRQCTNDPGPDGAANPVRGRDPDYNRGITRVPAPGAVTEGDPPQPVVMPDPLPDPPVCPAAGWRIDVWPGWFDDAALLNLLTGGACADRVVWFHPGDYYFNFGFRGGATTWVVNDPTLNVVGGSAKGDWPDGAAKPDPFPMPDACKGDDSPAEGVRFVLGGRSRLDVQQGKVELCASASTIDQRIAVHGDAGPRAVHTLAPSTAPVNGGFTTPEHAFLIGEVGPVGLAQATLDADQPEATLTVGTFRPFVPGNAVIDSAVLRVAHHDVGAVGAVSVELSAPQCGGPKSIPLRPDGLVEDTLDLKAECGWNTGIPSLGRSCDEIPATPPDNGDCLTVTYTAAGAGGTAVLDGIWIDVSYREPVTRKPGGALAGGDPPAFANPAHALQIGEQPAALTADAALTPTAPAASLQLTGYGEPGVQPGASLDHAVLRVAHHEDGDVSSLSVTVPGACGTIGAPDLTLAPTVHVDTIDLEGCGLTAADLLGFAVTFTAAMDPSATGGSVHVDGIWLDLLTGPPPTQKPIGHDGGAGGFTITPENVTLIDGEPTDAGTQPTKVAQAALSTGTPSATMGVGFGVALPRGAVPLSAGLLVAHQDDSPELVPPVVSIRASDDGGATDCLPETFIPASPGALSTWGQALPLSCLDDLSQLAVTYKVALGTGGTQATDFLDGIELDLRYQPATVRRPAAHDDGTGGFTDFANALSIDGANAFAALDAAAVPPRTQAAIAVSDFGAPLPAGSRLDSALLRVAHRDESLDAVPLVVTLRASTDGGLTFCLDKAVTVSAAEMVVDTTDLLADSTCSLDDPAALVVIFAAALGEGGTAGTAHLDGVELDLHFRPPAFEAVAGCAAEGPYPPAAPPPDPPPAEPGCALVKVGPGTAGGATRLVVQGTVYTPTAPVDIRLDGVTDPVVTRGIAARTIRLGLNPATTRALISVPPESGTFTVHWAHSLRAAAAADQGGFADADAGRVIDHTTASPGLATGTVDPGGAPASLLLSGYPSASATWAEPPVLRVRHEGDIGGAEATEVQVVVTLSNGDALTFSSNDQPCQLCLSRGSLSEDHLALDDYDHDANPDTDRVPVTPALLDGATVAFRVIGPAGATAHVDGIEIVEVLSGPKVRTYVEFPPDEPTAVVSWSVLY